MAGDGPLIIKRIKKSGGEGHHGGAWKVAYADFVTAMMAFFLLMWLLNATSEDQRRGLADYFAPGNVLARAATGSGEPFAGRTMNAEGDLVSDNGAVRIEPGPAPVRLDIEAEEEEDAPAPPPPHPAAAATEAAARPLPPTPAPPQGVQPPEAAALDAAQLSEAALRAELH